MYSRNNLRKLKGERREMRFKAASVAMLTLLTISILSIFPILAPQVKAQTGWWTTKTSLPHPQAVFGTAVVNSKIYAIGGQYRDQDQYVWLDTNYKYDSLNDNWIPRASMPTKRSTLTAVSANDKIYAIGGAASVSGGALSTNEEFDPVSNSWTVKASMPTPRNWISAAVVNGKVYVIGGSDNSGDIFSMNEMYDPLTDTWITKAQCPHARLACGIGVVNGKIYLIGGWVRPGSPPGEPTTLNEEYDPQADTWTTKTPMPTARNGLGVAVVNNRIYAIGGATDFNPWTNNLNVVEEYDPSTDTWRTVESMPTSRSLLSTAAIGNKIYALGGVRDSHANTGYLDANEEFNVHACTHWPMFLHDCSHTGYSSSEAPSTNSTIWTYMTGGGVLSSPAVTDGKVYVGSRDNHVYCLDALTGAQIWNYTVGEAVDLSSPAVANGKVIIGSKDDRIYCLNASTGMFIWSFETGGDVLSSATVVEDKVYIGSNDHRVYCLSVSTGAQIWNYSTGYEVISSPAVSDGRVNIQSRGGRVYCLNASTGIHVWNYTTGFYTSESSPAIAYGEVFVGSDDGYLHCLNASTGTEIWSHSFGSAVEASPAVAHGRVYVGESTGKIYCLNASTGETIWYYATQGSDIDSSPAVADDKVYIGSPDYRLYCLNASTGTFIWSYRTQNIVDSSPAIAYGNVYVGSLDGRVYSFGQMAYAYQLIIETAGGGTTAPSPGIYTYAADSSIQVTANPDTDFILDYWELDGSNVGSANPYTVTMNQNHTLKAVFVYSPPLPAVGGKATPINLPVSEFELLTPYIGLTMLLVASVATIVYIKKRKRHTEINT